MICRFCFDSCSAGVHSGCYGQIRNQDNSLLPSSYIVIKQHHFALLGRHS